MKRQSHLRHLAFYGELIVMIPPSVQEPDEYSAMLARAIVGQGPPGRALDLTTGTGFHALVLAAAGWDVVAVDRSPQAVEAAQQNAVLNGLSDWVHVREGDLYAALAPDERFECIVSWPPVMPTPPGYSRSDWFGVANDGGADGRAVLDRVIRGACEHLAPGGVGRHGIDPPLHISVTLLTHPASGN